MKVLKSVLGVFDALNKRVGEGASFLIYPLMLIIAYEVIMRYVFNAPTSWVHDLSREIYGAYIVLIGGYVLLKEGHVNMEVLRKRLPMKIATAMDLVSYLFGFLFISLLLWKAIPAAIQSTRILERSANPSNIPVYMFPMRVIIIIGAGLFLLQLLAVYIRKVILIIKGNKL